MKLKHISILLASLLMLNACSDTLDQPGNGGEETYTYSFTAILDDAKTRVNYEEDKDENGNPCMKMVWEEGDVIRLYPDASMNDETHEYYEFKANTGAGTPKTVFVYQGYIKGWENFKGRAIHVFANGENYPDDKPIDHDSEEYLNKSRVQAKNGSTDHLRYGEFKPGEDGKKQFSEYWSKELDGYNLKHDIKLTFSHPHTVVYKIMLKNFIYDIPGGSVLRMHGTPWGNDEVSELTLGQPGETFLAVGSYPFKKNTFNNVPTLVAYMIRQVGPEATPDADGTLIDGTLIDGTLEKGGEIYFELLTYDPMDGTVFKLHHKGDVISQYDNTYTHRWTDVTDPTKHRVTAEYGGKDYNNNTYFTNLPWGEEYYWEVTYSKEEPILYKAGDFVVADLTQSRIVTKKHVEQEGGTNTEGSFTLDESLPYVAVDLGLPSKWSICNVGVQKAGATRDAKNSTRLYDYGYIVPNFQNHQESWHEKVGWLQGDTLNDVSTLMGDGWIMPDVYDFMDLMQYCKVYINEEHPMIWNLGTKDSDTNKWSNSWGIEKSQWDKTSGGTVYNNIHVIRPNPVFSDNKDYRVLDNHYVYEFKSFINGKSIFFSLPGNRGDKGLINEDVNGCYRNWTIIDSDTNDPNRRRLPYLFMESGRVMLWTSSNQHTLHEMGFQRGYSVRAVRRRPDGK